MAEVSVTTGGYVWTNSPELAVFHVFPYSVVRVVSLSVPLLPAGAATIFWGIAIDAGAIPIGGGFQPAVTVGTQVTVPGLPMVPNTVVYDPLSTFQETDVQCSVVDNGGGITAEVSGSVAAQSLNAPGYSVSTAAATLHLDMWAMRRILVGAVWYYFTARLYPTTVVDAHGSVWHFPWNALWELQDFWTEGGFGGYVVGGGMIEIDQGAAAPPPVADSLDAVFDWADGGPGQPAALTAMAMSPIWRYRAAVADLYETMLPNVVDASILGNAVRDPCPWIAADGARFVAFERAGDVEYIRRTSGWAAPVLIRAARTNPCAIRLDPSEDVMVACIDAATDLKINNLRWNGAGYNVDAEIDVGVTASDTGDFFLLEDGQVGLVYQDVPGNIQVITSDLSGAVWA